MLVRPSGTEPKLKCYCEAIEPVVADGLDAARAAGAGRLGATRAALDGAARRLTPRPPCRGRARIARMSATPGPAQHSPSGGAGSSPQRSASHTAIPAVRAEGPWVEAAERAPLPRLRLGHRDDEHRAQPPASAWPPRWSRWSGWSTAAVCSATSRSSPWRSAWRVITPGDIGSFFFLNGGSEANEGAVKLARRVTGRHGVVVFRGGFHGRTQGGVGYTTSKSYYRAGYAPLGASVYVAPFPTPYRWGADMDEAVDRTLCGRRRPAPPRAAVDEAACYLDRAGAGRGRLPPRRPAAARGAARAGRPAWRAAGVRRGADRVRPDGRMVCRRRPSA